MIATRHFVALYVVTAIVLIALAIFLHAGTVAPIRSIHPDYPRSMTFSVYTPSMLFMVIHLYGVQGILVFSTPFAGVVAWASRRRRFGIATTIATTHLVLLALLMTCYALSAIQLARYVAG